MASVSGDVTTMWRHAKPRSLWSDAARTFSRSRAGLLGLALAVLLLLVGVFASWLAPYDPLYQDWEALRQPPTAQHLLGTDEVGRDVLSRIMMGIRTAILVAVIMTGISTTVGLLVSTVCTLIGGWVDAVLVWVMDALLNFPTIWLAAFVSVVTRPTIARLMQSAYKSTGWEGFKDPVVLDYILVFGVLAFVSWPSVGRLVRGQVLSLREKEFIEAQHAVGASTWWIATRHLVPNVLGPVIVSMSASFGGAMLAESSLSFLGIGIRPPGASLGNMIASSVSIWRSSPHLVLMPGLTLSLAVLAFNFMGDALNDALNPRSRER